MQEIASNKYSVLMAVYKSENAANFETAIKSMLNQTIAPSDFVIVCDGSLNDELDEVINRYEKAEHSIFNIVRLPNNEGLGNALSIGLNLCKFNYVLRMDSDDIAIHNRAETELKALEEGYDIVGGYVAEFEDGNEDKIIGVRKVPLEQKEIYEFVKKRTPFNHPSVAYNKEFVLSSGNYSKLRKSQDWELWVRCICNKAKVKNFDQVFVKMRSGKQLRRRRGGKLYMQCQTYILKEMRDLNMISGSAYRRLKFSYKCYSIMPMWLKTIFTKLFLRH